MRLLAGLVISAFAWSCSVAARANTLVPFTVTGNLPNGGTALGTFTIDSTAGYLSTDNIVVKEGGFSYTFIGSFIELNYVSGTINDLYSVSYDQGGDALTLVFPEALLTGYGGGPLCTVSVAPCGSFLSTFTLGGTPQGFTSLVATAATPEPGTFVLLGTGLLALVRARRLMIK